ncbi:MAG: prolyl oligopeptidase family serine peptidase [Spirosomataceae bacterium]
MKPYYLLLLLCPLLIKAQKKPLTHDVYDSWKSVGERQLSNDGKWAVFAINPQEGDGNLIIQSLQSDKKENIARGNDSKITFDSENVIFKIKPQFQATKDAKKAKKKKDEMPKDSLGIYAFANAKLSKIPKVSSYKIPEKAGGWLAYLTESPAPKTPKKDSTSKTETKKKAPKKESEDNGYKLVLLNLKTNTEQSFGFVTEYDFPKFGKYLSFVSTGNDSTLKSGVYVYDLEKGQLTSAFESKGKFRKLSFTETGDKLSFIADLDTNTKTQIRNPKLMLWKNGEKAAETIADNQNNPTKDWFVNADYAPRFSKDGSKLYFGTNPKPLVPDTTLLAEEIVKVDIWNYKDVRLQPQQLVSAEQDKKKAYLSVYDTKAKSFAQLATKEIPTVELAKDGDADFAIGVSTLPYSNAHWDWHGQGDIYYINLKDGKATQIAKGIMGANSVNASPDAKYITWFSDADTAYFAYSIKSAKVIKMTNDKKFTNADEDDHPDYPNAYGNAGWTKNDEQFLVYDKFDIWAINPNEPSKLTNLTNGIEKGLTYRNIRLDTEERSIDLKKPLLFRVFDNKTKQSGFVSYNNSKISPLIMGDYNFTFATKSKQSDAVLFQRSNFRECPDLYATDLSFKNIKKISDANPQQKDYSWGTVEMVKWNSLDGIPLEGLLYKPEGFDPSKKYPMITYFYEKESDNINDYREPSPSRSAINYSYYVSNGYVLFVPDIVYKIGYPGESAYNCIIPGVQSIVNKGFIDEKRLGVQGHSWGGYQTAYLITKTNLFSAAESGAPVVNMTSAYGGIRWGTGLSRQAQYEYTQSRIGGNLWDKYPLYIENSPLFSIPKVKTPVLILHNDADDAVPWYQGIEMFMALKRLNKPTWLLNYNGERHGIMQRHNRKDFSMRMSQFFDYYLKDAPMPQWMKDGVPAAEKTLNYGLEAAK